MSLSNSTYTLSVVFCILLLLSSCTSLAQVSPLLVEKTEVPSLIDSIIHPLVVDSTGEVKKYTPAYTFIEDLSVNQITYMSDGLKVKGYLTYPKKPGKYPCIIWNRGGALEFGAINPFRAAAMQGQLAKKGYVVIATQYRGNGGSEGQEEWGGKDINDVLNLIKVLEEIPQADTERIGMFGGSRGGMMTYIALSKTDRLKAGAVLAGPADFEASIKSRPSLENFMFDLVEGYEQNKEQEIYKRSPIKWVDKFPKDVPILIMHGNADWRVKSTQSLNMALELDKHRIPYRLLIFEGADHGLTEFRKQYYEELTDWFDRYLKNDSPLPNMEYHGG